MASADRGGEFARLLTLVPYTVVVMLAVVEGFLFPGLLPLWGVVVGTAAIGQALVARAGGVDLSAGALAVLVAHVGYVAWADSGVAWPLAAAVAVGVGAAGGWWNGLLVTRGGVAPWLATLTNSLLFGGLVGLDEAVRRVPFDETTSPSRSDALGVLAGLLTPGAGVGMDGYGRREARVFGPNIAGDHDVWTSLVLVVVAWLAVAGVLLLLGVAVGVVSRGGSGEWPGRVRRAYIQAGLVTSVGGLALFSVRAGLGVVPDLSLTWGSSSQPASTVLTTQLGVSLGVSLLALAAVLIGGSRFTAGYDAGARALAGALGVGLVVGACTWLGQDRAVYGVAPVAMLALGLALDRRRREPVPPFFPAGGTGAIDPFACATAAAPRMECPEPATPFPSAEPVAAIDGLLPVIRVRDGRSWSRATTYQEIVALYPDHLILARLPVGEAVPEDAYRPSGSAVLTRHAAGGVVEDIPLSEVERVVLEPASRTSEVARLVVCTGRGTVTLAVPDHETHHLALALAGRLGPRFEAADRIRFRCHPVAAAFLSLGVGLMLLSLGRSDWAAASASLVLTLAAAGFVALDNRPRRRVEDDRNAPPGKDISHRRPVRSVAVGRAFKVAGVALLLTFFALESDAPAFVELVTGLVPGSLDQARATRPWLWAALHQAWLLCGLVLLFAGYVLAYRKPDYLKGTAGQAPVVFLRSFRDDGRGTLNPQNNLAMILGLEPSWSFARMFGPFARVFNLHPVRLFRLTFGRAADTGEEQLGLFFRKFGPFVAIGKPGERLATPGAERLYVGHDEWQEVVRDLLFQARFVVLQPASTRGIWWEVETTLRSVGPERVLFCLSNFRRRQNDYETFRLRVEAITGRNLPRSLGNRDEVQFLYFDADGTPRDATLSLRSPLDWPLVGQAANLDYTLGQIVDRQPGRTPRPPQRHPGHGLMSVVLYAVMVPLAWWLFKGMVNVVSIVLGGFVGRQ